MQRWSPQGTTLDKLPTNGEVCRNSSSSWKTVLVLCSFFLFSHFRLLLRHSDVFCHTGTSSSSEAIRDASLMALLKLSAVESHRPYLAPHLPVIVKIAATGVDKAVDVALQIIVNLTTDGGCFPSSSKFILRSLTVLYRQVSWRIP